MKKAFGFPNYEVDESGIIRNSKTLKNIPVRIHKRCPEVLLSKDGRSYHVQFARLMLMTFNPCEMADKMQVYHMDKNRLNNSIENLLWVLPSQHSMIHKLMRNNNCPNLDFGDF